jgi:mannose-6-phosphate isomerase
VLLVRAGTVHALGPGLAVFEVQQNSDTTWRIHDWGRGRPVHLAQARESARDLGAPTVLRAAQRRAATTAAAGWEPLISAGVFALRAARVSGRLPLEPPREYALLTVLQGRGRVSQDGAGRGGRLELAPGDTVFVHGAADLEGEGLAVLVVDPPE